MAAGTNIRTYFEGTWHDGNVPIMRAADHGSWLGSTVFDGARYFDGIAPDLLPHCTRVNASARALMMEPTMTPEEMVNLAWEGLAAYSSKTAVYIRPMYWAVDGDPTAIVPAAETTAFAMCLERIPMPSHKHATTLTRHVSAAPFSRTMSSTPRRVVYIPTTHECWPKRGQRASATRWSPMSRATWPKPPQPTCSWSKMAKCLRPLPTVHSCQGSPAHGTSKTYAPMASPCMNRFSVLTTFAMLTKYSCPAIWPR